MDAVRRAIVLLGSGTSLDYGAPSTAKLTEAVKRKVPADRFMQTSGGASVYVMIEETDIFYAVTTNYAANFEWRTSWNVTTAHNREPVFFKGAELLGCNAANLAQVVARRRQLLGEPRKRIRQQMMVEGTRLS